MKNSILRDIRPIGITPGRVTEIAVESTEAPSGSVKREPTKSPRPHRIQIIVKGKRIDLELFQDEHHDPTRRPRTV